jgi:hypothetical protein
MEQQNLPRGSLVVAVVAVLLLLLAGVVWLGFSQEMLRAEVAALDRAFREQPRATAPADTSPEIQVLTEAVGKLAAEVDALAATDPAKAVSRLSVDVKALAGRVDVLASRVEALAKVKAAAPRPTKSVPARKEELPEPPRPFYGPGYPAWPGY